MGSGLEFFGEAEDFADECLFAFGGEDAGGFGCENFRGVSEFFLFDERLGLEEDRLEPPLGLGEIGQQAFGGGHRIGEFLVLQHGGGLEQLRLLGRRILGGDRLIGQRRCLVVLPGAHFRLDLRQRRGCGGGLRRGESEGD